MATIILKDGSEKEITLSYGDLLKLESKNPKLAEEYFKIQAKESLNEIDVIKVLRIAYISTTNQEVTLEGFCELISNNRSMAILAYNNLIYPKN